MRHIISLFTSLTLLMMTMACNEIENVGFDAESITNRLTVISNGTVLVTQNEASGIADLFVRSNAGNNYFPTKSAGITSKIISSTETIREDGQNLMYVFNYEGGGFVIVGSTRNYYPILAYSDNGSFVLQEDMGAVDVWLDETKVCIKNSSALSDETKVQMQKLWARYDGTYSDHSTIDKSARRPQTRSTGEDACWERIDELYDLYGNEGWTFLPLSFVEDVFDDAGLSSCYDDICYYANQNHSALNETVIGYKNAPIYDQEGPLLSSDWHQGSPYNSLCQNNCAAGCATIAIAQVMRYHLFPQPPGNLSWNNIPASFSSWNSNYQHPELIMLVRQYLGLSGTDTGVSNNDIEDALDAIGFDVDMTSHNYVSVRNELFGYSNPVIMTGYSVNFLSLPNGHCWVCDGVQENTYNQITFFTENQPYGAGTFTQGMYSHNSPGIEGGNVYLYFHMNWGWSPSSLNGWYAYNNFTSAPDGNNYQYLRKDFYVATP